MFFSVCPDNSATKSQIIVNMLDGIAKILYMLLSLT